MGQVQVYKIKYFARPHENKKIILEPQYLLYFGNKYNCIKEQLRVNYKRKRYHSFFHNRRKKKVLLKGIYCQKA